MRELQTVEYMYINGGGVSGGGAAAVLAGVRHAAAVNDQHAHQHLVGGLLADDDTGARVRLQREPLSIPADVIGSTVTTGGVTDESDAAAELHVASARHLHHCTNVRTARSYARTVLGRV